MSNIISSSHENEKTKAWQIKNWSATGESWKEAALEKPVKNLDATSGTE